MNIANAGSGYEPPHIVRDEEIEALYDIFARNLFEGVADIRAEAKPAHNKCRHCGRPIPDGRTTCGRLKCWRPVARPIDWDARDAADALHEQRKHSPITRYRERDLREHDVKRMAGNLAEAYGQYGDPDGGAFVFPSPVDGRDLGVIASVGEGWDHVSVSRKDRAPIWREMECIKRKCFRDDEVAMQLHVPASINIHPYCLHLWRPHGQPIPLPPRHLV